MIKFATSYFVDGIEYGSFIYALSWEHAEIIAQGRNLKETVIGIILEEGSGI